MERQRATWVGLLLLFVAVALLWNTWVVYPLKVLVVFFHELSHGVAALATGGEIVEIRLEAEQGGVCVTRGGSRFLILSAGYLGSLLIGGLILLWGAKTKRDKQAMAVLGVVLLVVTLLFVRPWFEFGMIFGLLTGAVLLLVAGFLSEGVNDFLLLLIGLTSCLYAVLDIKSDVLDRPELESDARMLAEHTGLPTVLWGLVWIAIALLAAVWFVRRAAGRGDEPSDAGAAAGGG